MKRFMQVHKDRDQAARNFSMASDNEDAEEDQDEGCGWEAPCGRNSFPYAAGDRARQDAISFFPSPKAEETVSKVSQVPRYAAGDRARPKSS